MAIKFDDNLIIEITGKVIKKFKSAGEYHYEFVYLTNNERVVDQIFKEIFKKQIEIKQMLSGMKKKI